MATRSEYVAAFERCGFDAVTAQLGADRMESGPYFGFVDVTESLLSSRHMTDLAARAHFIRERARAIAPRLEPKGPTVEGRPISEVQAELRQRELEQKQVDEQRHQAARKLAANREAAAADGARALAEIDECLGLASQPATGPLAEIDTALGIQKGA